MTRIILVTLYLAAICCANISLEYWGPQAAIWNSFLYIGLDLTCRDRLHDEWRGKGFTLHLLFNESVYISRLLSNMAALIAAGSALSYLLNRDTGRIAVASCVAFGAAAIADGLLYHLLRDRPWYERANQSNVAGAAVDSLLFLPLAFGIWPWTLMFGMFCAKVAGGVVWSFVLGKGAEGRAWVGRQRERYG